MLEHEFTEKIFTIINANLGEDDIAEDIYLRSGLVIDKKDINFKKKD